MIAVQTRPEPNHMEANREAMREADLCIRLRQDPATQVPDELGFLCLQETLPRLIDAVHDSGPKRVVIGGGCHPSLAWALGSALPAGRPRISFTWRDTYPERVTERVTPSGPAKPYTDWDDSDSKSVGVRFWRVGDGGAIEEDRLENWVASGASAKQTADSRNLLVLLACDTRPDMRPLLQLASKLEDPAAVLLITPEGVDGTTRYMVNPAEGPSLADQMAQALVSLGRGRSIHLTSSIPVALLSLVARRCNTLTVDFYDLGRWPATGERAYIRICQTYPGDTSPIVKVFPRPRMSDRPVTLTNLTPHDVTLRDGETAVHTWPRPDSDDDWVRRVENREQDSPLEADEMLIPLTRVSYGQLAPTPPQVPGVGYIVSRVSAAYARRDDFFFPDGETRDENNVVNGCRGLGRFEGSNDRVRFAWPYLQRGS